MPASTCPTSVVGTATHGMPRRYVAAANAARSVVEPPPSATTVPSRSSVSSDQSRPATASCFAASPGGISCVETSRDPSAFAAAAPCRPSTVASATSATGPSPGTRSPSRSSAPSLMAHTCRGQYDTVGVAARDACVRYLVVDGLPLLVEATERRLVLGERPVAAADALPRGIDVDLDQDGERSVRERGRGRSAS